MPPATSASSRSRPTNVVSCRRSDRLPRADQPEGGHRLAACPSTAAARPARHRRRRGRARRVASRDQHLTRLRRLLQPRRHVHRVTGREPLLGTGHHLAVLTPIRPSIPSPANASRISTAARHARSASSSCTTGTPNTAITASPMNFSTEPPCARRSPSSLEIPGQQRPQRLGIGRLTERRRTDHVAEQRRDDLPTLTRPDPDLSTTPLTKPRPPARSRDRNRHKSVTARA